MKILRAKKFQPRKRNDSNRAKSDTTLRKTDWEVLVQHDRIAGKINLRSEAALKDPGSVRRLLEAGMIDPNGKLTAEGRKKCGGLIQKLMKPESQSAAVAESPKAEQAGESEDKQIDKLTASDWAVLMKYDRKTGNLLTYDPQTGELDNTSRAVLKDPSIIQRLIDNNKILPGGWLTPEAKQECGRIKEKLKNQPADGYTGPKGHPEQLSKDEQLSKGEHKSKDEPQSNHVQQSKDTPQSKGAPEAKMDTGPKSERFSDKLSKIYTDRKDDPEPDEPSDTKPEAVACFEQQSRDGQVPRPHAIRQHYPDPNPELLSKGEKQSKGGRKPADSSEQAPKAGAENQKLDGQDLQVFFEQLPVDYSEPSSKGANLPNDNSVPNLDPNPERLSKGERMSNGELLSKGELKSKDKQQTISYPALGQKKEREKPLDILGSAGTPLKETASNRTRRRFDLKAVSRPEGVDEERPRRKKKDSGGSGGDITGPPRFSLRDVFHIIFKRKLQIFVCFFFIVFMATVATLLMKPVYEASAQILVKLGRESVFVPTSGNVTPILNINREQQVNSEIEILKSRSLAEKVVADIGPTILYKSLAEEKSGILSFILPDKRRDMTPDERKAADFESAVAGFMKALDVTGVKKSNVIQVRFKNENPLVAAKVVNELSNMYLGHHLAVHKTPQNVKFFQEQTDLLKNKLDQSEEQLKALRKQHNITALDEQRTLLLGRSSVLNSGLNETISLEVETEKRIRLLSKQLASVPETISQGEETDQNQNPYLINTLETRLVELQLKEKELLTKYTDQSRLVQNVKEEIRVVEQKLEEHSTKRYGRKTSGANPTHQRLKEELFRNEAELEALKAKKITQKEHLVGLQIKLENLNQVELELKQLEQNIEVDRENYRLYLSKVEESRISEAMDSEKIASVSLIGPARPPRKPASPKVMLNLLIGIFLGIFGSMSLALFREYLDDRIEKIEDVETELHLPVLASIPIFEQRVASTGSFT